MAMSCIKDQVPMEMEKEFSTVITRMAMYLLSKQKGDGSFGNPVTSAFAFQVKWKDYRKKWLFWDEFRFVTESLSFTLLW